MGPNRGPELAGVAGAFLTLSYIFVGLRVYVRTIISKNWGYDDWLLIIAQIFFTTYTACAVTGIRYGTGRHLPDIPPTDIPRALYNWWLCEIFYALSTAFIRFSIAGLFLRICIQPVHKYIIYGTSGVVAVFTTFYCFLIIFQCSPVNFFWDQYNGIAGHCIADNSIPIASIVHSCVSFTADWALGLLPIFLIYNLKMNSRSKWSLAAVLSLGLVAGIAAMVRIPYIRVLSITADFLWNTTDIAIWSTIEPGLGLIAAGAATLRPLFRKFYNLSTRNGTNRADTHSSRWRNTRLDYLRSNSAVQHNSRKHSDINSEVSQDIQLKGDGLQRGIGGVVTNVSSPFADSTEELRDRDMRRKQRNEILDGIQIDRTVAIDTEEVGRASDDDYESLDIGKASQRKRRNDFV